MNDFRRRFDRFVLKNRDKGIANLMLYVAIGNLIVYVLTIVDPSRVVWSYLRFDRSAILSGQVWRLVSYVFTYLLDIAYSSRFGVDVFLGLVTLFCYYQFGKILESYWGSFKFTLYYLTGVVLMDIGAMIFGAYVSTSDLNLSLFLAVATIAPDAQVLLFFFIPIKMKYMAWFYLGFTALEVVMDLLSYGLLGFGWLFPILALGNYFLFFGGSIRNIFPSRRPRSPKNGHRPTGSARPNPNWANGYQSNNGERPYHHKCTVCGRTDTEYPNLEFRYCSKCKGYYCYCIDHINNHVHIQ